MPGARAGEGPGVPVRLGFVSNPFSLPLLVAVDHGYLDQVGVRIALDRFANGSAVSAALAAGTLDVGVSGHLQTLMAGSGGDRQVFVAPLGFEEAPHHLPITLLGAPGVSEARQLEGRAVAVSALGAISELQLRVFMDGASADYRSLRLVAMGFGEMGDALASGRVAAASVPEPFATELLAAGTGRLLDRGSLSHGLAPGQRALVAGLAATARWAADHRAAVEALTEAVGRAVDDLRTHEPLAAAVLAGITGRTPGPGMHTPAFDRHLEEADLQRVFDLAYRHGLLSQPADAGRLLA